MKTTLLSGMIAFLTLASWLAPVARADGVHMPVNAQSYAAIAYSPATARYGYAYNYRSRSAAEKEALLKCGAADACITCWVNAGVCALALGDDKTRWGAGWEAGQGSTNRGAMQRAQDECRKTGTTGVYIAICLSSDGQYIWEPDSKPVLRSNGDIVLPSGQKISGDFIRDFQETAQKLMPAEAKDNSSPAKHTDDDQPKK